MSTAYYYFAASLPTVAFDTASIYSLESFLAGCERLLSPRDHAEILCVLDEADPRAGSRVTRDWKNFLRNLRNQGVAVRAAALRKDPQSFFQGDRVLEAEIVEAVALAGKSEDPLSGEKILDQFKWQRIEEITAGHHFDLEYLMGYALKLQLIDRFEKMDSVKGAQVFDEYQKAAKQIR